MAGRAMEQAGLVIEPETTVHAARSAAPWPQAREPDRPTSMAGDAGLGDGATGEAHLDTGASEHDDPFSSWPDAGLQPWSQTLADQSLERVVERSPRRPPDPSPDPAVEPFVERPPDSLPGPAPDSRPPLDRAPDPLREPHPAHDQLAATESAAGSPDRTAPIRETQQPFENGRASQPVRRAAHAIASALRHGLSSRTPAAGATDCAMRFSAVGGPVLAVCGLAGGVGTTSLAVAIARAAADQSSVPVLLAEAESCAGQLAAVVPDGPVTSLCDLALGHGELAVPSSGLTVLAAHQPRAPRNVLKHQRGAATLHALDALRAAYGLTVIDCGTLMNFDARLMLSAATHVVWVLATDRAAVGRARSLLVSGAAPHPAGAREVIAAVAARARHVDRRGVRTLRELAELRCERLVLVPHLPSLVDDGAAAMVAEMAGSLAGFASFLGARSAQ
ncbi:MAG: hypothetical protein V7607_5465 [Solirubrobacteraceae bacterium]